MKQDKEVIVEVLFQRVVGNTNLFDMVDLRKTTLIFKRSFEAEEMVSRGF